MPVTRYVWDMRNDSYLMEKDGNGQTTAVYTNKPVPYGHIISQRRNGQSRYHRYDGQQSTRQLTDENQNVTDTTTYTAFGKTVSKTGRSVNPFGYKGALGYYANPETKDIYVRARSLFICAARWETRDRLYLTPQFPFAGFSSDTSLPIFQSVLQAFSTGQIENQGGPRIRANAYSYAQQNPVMLWDPSGDAPVNSVLPCPLPCGRGQCEFELELERRLLTIPVPRGVQGPSERIFVFSVAMRFRPPPPTNIGQLDPRCGAACYGGFDRSAREDYIKYTLTDGTVCEMNEQSFPAPSPVPLPPGESNLSRECLRPLVYYGLPVGGAFGGAQYAFRASAISKIQVAFTIDTECHCGIGHVHIDDVPEEFAFSTTKGKLTLKDSLP